MSTNFMDDRLLLPKEAAAYLGWSLATIYTKVSRKQIDCVHIGRNVRFRLSDLNKMIEEGYRPMENGQ